MENEMQFNDKAIFMTYTDDSVAEFWSAILIYGVKE